MAKIVVLTDAELETRIWPPPRMPQIRRALRDARRSLAASRRQLFASYARMHRVLHLVKQSSEGPSVLRAALEGILQVEYENLGKARMALPYLGDVARFIGAEEE